MLAVAGGKGGCGKTTTAIALTRALANSERETPLLVDADTDMPDVHHRLGIDRKAPVGPRPNSAVHSGVDAVSNGVALSEAAQYPAGLAGGAVLTAGGRAETAIALDRCRRWTGPVVIDTPAGISPAVTIPLRMADIAVIVTTDEPSCLDDAWRTAKACSTLCPQSVGVVRTVTGKPPSQLAAVPVIGVVPTVSEPLLNDRFTCAIEEIADHLSRSYAGELPPARER